MTANPRRRGNRSVLFDAQTRALAGWKGMSALTEAIRVIVVIVGHPREVFDVPAR